ncbi:uncharacterized protein LOC129289950 [Prosopis cineraria]|uniref:uncharacterized protein LOC129289950 n=1 Tax=Prosopis cineraria TaxID=364024 RepID=UPI00240F7881|nr:uncharacterized protein LOC129289950 [Prosopis cineraria]
MDFPYVISTILHILFFKLFPLLQFKTEYCSLEFPFTSSSAAELPFHLNMDDMSSPYRALNVGIESPELPSDVLDSIAKKLDIDDLFSFGEVCKDWRMFHSDFWREFMASHAPLIVQKTPHAKRACSFFSISDERIYNTLLPFFSGFSLAGFSSGYMVMAGQDNAVVLVNPFARKKMTISGSPDQGCVIDLYDRATLAFATNSSEEFVLVALCTWSFNMHVYQSRNSSWVIYSRWGTPWRVMDVVVCRNTLYAITDEAEIGVVMLNNNNHSLKILEFSNKPIFATSNLKLVSTDDKLLVVLVLPTLEVEIFMIDLSEMAWFKIELLGDRALFLGVNSKCYSLSNPGMWGFHSNCVYLISRNSPLCKLVSLKNQVIRVISLPENRGPLGAKLCNIDWCFRSRRDEMDYALHEE